MLVVTAGGQRSDPGARQARIAPHRGAPPRKTHAAQLAEGYSANSRARGSMAPHLAAELAAFYAPHNRDLLTLLRDEAPRMVANRTAVALELGLADLG